MKRLRIFVLLFLLLCTSGMSMAQRSIPPYMQVAVLKDANGLQVLLGNDKFSWLRILTVGWKNGNRLYEMNTSVRVRNQKNMFITYNQLPRFKGEAVAVRLDQFNRVNELWILTPEEREQLRQRADRIEQYRKQNQ